MTSSRRLGAERVVALTMVATMALLAAVWSGAGLLAADPQGAVDPAQPGATPEVQPPREQSTCRLGTSNLQIDGTTVWTEVFNSGSTRARLEALEMGWRGEAVLERVVATQDDGSRVVLFDDEISSPAYLPVGAADLSLPAGEAVTIALELTSELSPDDLGPLLAFFSGGCTVAALPQLQSECPVAVEPLVFPTTAPFAAEFRIANPSADTMVLLGFRLAWPQEQNGSLVLLRLNGAEVAQFEAGRVNSPARLDLTRLLQKPVEIAPGDALVVRALFERPVSNDLDAYAVAVDDEQGCFASADPRGASGGCGVEALDLVPSPGMARLELVNLEPVTRTLEAIDLYWPASTAGHLREIRAGGKKLWTGDEGSSPAHVEFDAPPTLRPEGRGAIQFVFGDTEKEEDLRGMSTGGYSVVARFGGGCQTVFSTRTDGPVECGLSAGDIDAVGREAVLPVSNGGRPARLGGLTITWPEANGSLAAVALGSEELWSKVVTGRTFTLTVAADAKATLPTNEGRDLTFAFTGRAAAGPYAVTLDFQDRDGAACPPILVTARPKPAECRLGLSGLALLAETVVGVDLENQSAAAAPLQFINVQWPDGAAKELRRVSLVSPKGTTHRLWRSGKGAVSPARIVPDDPTVIETGSSRLEFRFAGPVDAASLAAFAIHVVADGCQASLQPAGDAALPEVEQLSGWVKSVPKGGLFGWWEVVVLQDGRSTVQRLWVDHGTQFDPPNIDPTAGDVITAEAIRDPEDRLRALTIRFQRPAFAELRGIVESISGGNPPASMVVNGQLVYIRDAVIKGRLVVGSVVIAQGTSNADGSVTAMKVEVIDQVSGEFVDFRGVLQDARPDPKAEGFQIWNVDGHRVRVDVDIAGLPSATALPAPGTRVHVKGRLADGLVRVLAPDDVARVLPEALPSQFTGSIIQRPPDGLVGTWVILDDEGGLRRVEVQSPAIVDTRLGEARQGSIVRIVAGQSAGDLVAIRIRTVAGR